MKTKTYTVTVTVSKDYTYRVTAEGALQAKKSAELMFAETSGGAKFDRIKSRAVADWVKKEVQSD